MEEGIRLKGKIIGFEDEDYLLKEIFGVKSPLRLLSSLNSPIFFLVVNPYAVLEDYNVEVEESLLTELGFDKKIEDIAILCIVRHEGDILYANLRCPLIINTKKGLFRQVILQNEGYPMGFPFAKKEGE